MGVKSKKTVIKTTMATYLDYRYHMQKNKVLIEQSIKTLY